MYESRAFHLGTINGPKKEGMVLSPLAIPFISTEPPLDIFTFHYPIPIRSLIVITPKIFVKSIPT